MNICTYGLKSIILIIWISLSFQTLPQTSISANGSIPSNCSIVSNGSHVEDTHAKKDGEGMNGGIESVQSGVASAPKSNSQEWDNVRALSF